MSIDYILAIYKTLVLQIGGETFRPGRVKRPAEKYNDMREINLQFFPSLWAGEEGSPKGDARGSLCVAWVGHGVRAGTCR